MNEAGTRVPFIAHWPGKIPPGRRGSFFSLMDVLPTLAATAKVPLGYEVDGMDLSHNLFNQPGKDREIYSMAFEGGCYFVRDKRFRLHEDGRFYDVPVTSSESRYDMNVIGDREQHLESRQRLQRHLEKFMAIQKTDTSYRVVPFGTNGDNFRNTQDRAVEKTASRSGPVSTGVILGGHFMLLASIEYLFPIPAGIDVTTSQTLGSNLSRNPLMSGVYYC